MTDSHKNSSKKLILNESLQSFFLDSLTEQNKKSLRPVPTEALYYSSEVLNEFVNPTKFFELNDEGKVRQKILGIKLLEAYQFSVTEQKRMYKDVGECALILCGMFNESVNRKILDINYYHSVGKEAYGRLNIIEREAYNRQEFYELISDCFATLATLINRVANIHSKHEDRILTSITNQDLTDDELLALGVLPNKNNISN